MNHPAVNRAEEFCQSVCRRSVLSLWCEPNPRGKEPGHELCDILVVCSPHVIIISVKEMELKGQNDSDVEHDRWRRRTIEASVKQIYGAERFLASAARVTRRNGTPGIALPPPCERKMHRIAVAFGSKGEIPIGSRDFDKGYVHVMSEEGFRDILTELDTITDLTDFLEAKEVSATSGCRKLVLGSEADLLGFYLLNNRTFPANVDLLLVDNTHWKGLLEKPEYQQKKKAEEDSYYWDRLIEEFTAPTGDLWSASEPKFDGLEFALRTMARESRFCRRILGRNLREFIGKAMAGGPRSLSMRGPSGVIYVFVFFKPTANQQERLQGLSVHQGLARHAFGVGATVIGVAFRESQHDVVNASELAYLDARSWSQADDEAAAHLKSEAGYDLKMTQYGVDEYEDPNTDSGLADAS